jgi:hypothetical protein
LTLSHAFALQSSANAGAVPSKANIIAAHNNLTNFITAPCSNKISIMPNLPQQFGDAMPNLATKWLGLASWPRATLRDTFVDVLGWQSDRLSRRQRIQSMPCVVHRYAYWQWSYETDEALFSPRRRLVPIPR